MAWRKTARDLFPAPLRQFREADWPPVEGECLEHYSGCHADGYEAACVPPPGQSCGQACYEMLARDYPGQPEVLAAAKRADAFTRYHQARLSWLGEDHPDYLEEFFDGDRHGEIRYAPFRAGREAPGGVAQAE
jgi:hypothetical protein